MVEKEYSGEGYNLIITSPTTYSISCIRVAKELSQKGRTLYVSVNRPFIFLKEHFNEKLKDIVFIDCISRIISDIGELKTLTQEFSSPCFFVKSPENLTDISVVIFEAIQQEKIDYVFFDSLSTLLLYNEIKSVAKFVHFLVGKLRLKKTHSTFVVVKNPEEKGFISQVVQFFDNVFEFF